MNVVITGASKGIGRSAAEIFAANGHNVFMCSRGEAALYKAMEELLTKFPGVTIKAKPFDLSIKEQAKEFGKWALEQTAKAGDGNIDVLINNAGIVEKWQQKNQMKYPLLPLIPIISKPLLILHLRNMRLQISI